MSFFKRIIPYLIPYKANVILNILFNILYAIFSGLSFFVIIPLLKVIFNGEQVTVTPPKWKGITSLSQYFNSSVTYYAKDLADKNGSNVLTFVILLIITVFLLKNLFNYLAIYNIIIVREGVLKSVRNKFYTKIVNLPISFYSEKRKGDVLSRIGTDITIMQGTYLSVLEMFVREPLTILVSLFLMFSTSVKLTLFIFIFIPIAGVILSKIGKTLKRQSNKVQTEIGTFLSLLEETLGGLKVIKGFNSETMFENKFQQSTTRLFKYANKLQHRTALASPVSEFLGIVVFSVLLWYGGSLVLTEKSLNGEDFIGFLALAYNILTPAKAISKASYNLKSGNAAAERVFDIIDTVNPLSDTKSAKEKDTFTSDIIFNNVSFKYEDEYVLNDLYLQIPKGKVVALVGQSGSGKSTIANLISRFYDVNSGEITIDNDNIKNVKKSSLRNLIGIVTQDSILFNDSIKNNMLLGKENATDSEIIEALKIANAWEFVKDLPNGINTNIGDSGNKLSGGQKQRISIARAVIKNPPIMVLDEATSALDTESEKLVQVALENMMKNRTSIVIAHRLSTIQKADSIIVMQKGKIIEQGNHQELINKNGTYKKLVEMQQLA